MGGANFFRADLHIHSFGDFGSYDVTDINMTPEAIVDTSIEKSINIISVTDHNEIHNCISAVMYSKEKEILVIPGIEVSTTQGHLLLYFETVKNLRDFYGKLNISEDKKTCQEGIVQCLNYAEQYNGIGILAHIELPSGFEKTIARFGPQMEEVLCHKNLYGLEISSKLSIDYYTESDTDDNRVRLLRLRREKLGLDENNVLPKLMSSDSHTLNKLGINADGDRKLTRIKVDDLSFSAFKIALLSHESRIRLEDFIPEQRPIIKSISIEGGLLDKINIDLSTNLTCIIGSRGAGKSTLLESIKVGTGNISESRVVDSDVWPQLITLNYEDEVGQNMEFCREKNNDLRNNTDTVNGITKIDIECYGQGETADTIQHSDENPLILVNFLDNFIDVNSLKLEDKELSAKLLNNQSESRKLRLELLSLDETKRALVNEERKLASLEKEKAGELVKLQNALIREREIRKNLGNDLKSLVKTYREILNKKEPFDAFDKLTDEEIIVGKDFFKEVKRIVSDFSIIVNKKSSELNDSLNLKIQELGVQLTNWTDKEKEIQEKIDIKKRDFEIQGIPFDLGKINQISKDINDLKSRVRKLENDQNNLRIFENERKSLILQRKTLKQRLFMIRNAYANTINDNLKNTMDGLFITVKYEEGKYSDSFEKQLKSVMEWRTSQVPKAHLIAKQMSPLEFVENCKKGDQTKFKSLKDHQGNRLLLDVEINTLLSRVNKDHCFEDFEPLEFEDRPSISVTKLYEDEAGNKKRNTKGISQLSLGQQQSVLLGILMLSKSKKPLLIDQPEDNLDSEFIFKTIVKNLRKIKESRQVIIVTHNPNIAVLGDAELIVPLKSTSVKSHVLASGSIDKHDTRVICCEILEGGKSAFEQRRSIYGI